MALDVTVNLTVSESKGAANFGIPLIVGAGQSAFFDYTECTKLSQVAELVGNDYANPIYKAAALLCKQENRPKTFAVIETSGSVVDIWSEIDSEDWRQLIVAEIGTKDTLANIAAHIEELGENGNYKMFFTSVSTGDSFDSNTWATAVNGLADYDRTVVMYYPESDADDVVCPEAALVGATAGYQPGNLTYKNIILKGVPALALTDAEITAITCDSTSGVYALTVVEKAGDIVTTDGRVASGEYIDVIDCKDWIIENISYDCQKLLNVNPKIPYTSVGLAQLEDTVISVLKTAFNNGMIAPVDGNDSSGDYSTDFTAISDVSDDDKSNRHYGGGSFTFTLAGAIHEAEINGYIVV